MLIDLRRSGLIVVAVDVADGSSFGGGRTRWWPGCGRERLAEDFAKTANIAPWLR
jgi:hypothetical protein